MDKEKKKGYNILNSNMEDKDMCRINPRIDFVFKKLFGTEENKNILIDFINAIVSEEDQVETIEIKNPYSSKDWEEQKVIIVDIKAQNQNGTWFNIEMQILEQAFFDKRALYYWSKVYTEQLTQGKKYFDLEKTISINILNFNKLEEENYHNCYKIINSNTGNKLNDQLEIHFIELQKYDEKLATRLDKWSHFLKNSENYKNELPKELAENKNISKAFEILETMNLNPKEQKLYEQELKSIRDLEGALYTREIHAKKEISIEIANNLLDILDNKTISEKVGLTEEEVEKLRKKIK